MNKRKTLIFASALFTVLLFAAAAIAVFASSSLHPKNITDETVIKEGTEYTVRVSGVREYDENGFVIGTDGFDFTGKRVYACTGEDGLMLTASEGKDEAYIYGKYNSDYISYESYAFTGSTYDTREKLEKFFQTPNPIYNFDVNKLGQYIGEIIGYVKRFYGKATVKIYRGRCVITEVYIGDELVLIHK